MSRVARPVTIAIVKHMIVAIIQARMSSRRLPGKMLLPLGDTTIIGHTVRQVQKAKNVDHVVVATSDDTSDDALTAFCEKTGVEVFRGNLNDVLDRYYHAAKKAAADTVVRVTGDCPLIDPAVIDRAVEEYKKGNVDYLSTGHVASTFPDGTDVEVFSFAALESAWHHAKLPSEREHVTPYIWNHPELFRVTEMRNDPDLGFLRITIDEIQDYEVIQAIVAHVPELTMKNISAYIANHPEISHMNASIVRDAGYLKSLREDARQ